MYKHTFDNTILRSYDIRGIYGKTLSDEDAFMLGFFFGITVREKNPHKKHTPKAYLLRVWTQAYIDLSEKG